MTLIFPLYFLYVVLTTTPFPILSFLPCTALWGTCGTSVTTLYPASGTGINAVPLKSVAKENQLLLEYPLNILSQMVYVTSLFTAFKASLLWCGWLQRSLPHKKKWWSQLVEGSEQRRSWMYTKGSYICKANTNTVTLGAICKQHGTSLSDPNTAPLNPLGISSWSSGGTEQKQQLHNRVNLRKAMCCPQGDASQSYDKCGGGGGRRKIYQSISDKFLSML